MRLECGRRIIRVRRSGTCGPPTATFPAGDRPSFQAIDARRRPGARGGNGHAPDRRAPLRCALERGHRAVGFAPPSRTAANRNRRASRTRQSPFVLFVPYHPNNEPNHGPQRRTGHGRVPQVDPRDGTAHPPRPGRTGRGRSGRLVAPGWARTRTKTTTWSSAPAVTCGRGYELAGRLRAAQVRGDDVWDRRGRRPGGQGRGRGREPAGLHHPGRAVLATPDWIFSLDEPGLSDVFDRAAARFRTVNAALLEQASETRR